jgi:hypothetical protein
MIVEEREGKLVAESLLGREGFKAVTELKGNWTYIDEPQPVQVRRPMYYWEPRESGARLYRDGIPTEFYVDTTGGAFVLFGLPEPGRVLLVQDLNAAQDTACEMLAPLLFERERKALDAMFTSLDTK